LELVNLEGELSQLTRQLMRSFEELTLIHELSRSLDIAANTATHCQHALDRLSRCLPVPTVAVIWESQEGDSGEIVQSGQTLDEAILRQIHREIAGIDAAIFNQPLATVAYDRVASVILERNSRGCSYLLAVGQSPIPELGTVEIQLMQSVAMILQAHFAVHNQFAEMRQMFEATVRALVSAIEAKDPYTCGHSERVAEMASALAMDMGLPEDEVDTIRMAGLLHDIGKIGVADEVLRKPDRLAPHEFEEIKKHPELGYQILKGIRQFEPMLPGVRYHHESWNGKGYPAGLKGEEIPLIARILAVADAFDAMSSNRPYREGLPQEEVENILLHGRGTQWEAGIVDIMLSDRERLSKWIESGRQ
jgi:putative nucleotidyltransferase with HDIG domain